MKRVSGILIVALIILMTSIIGYCELTDVDEIISDYEDELDKYFKGKDYGLHQVNIEDSAIIVEVRINELINAHDHALVIFSNLYQALGYRMHKGGFNSTYIQNNIYEKDIVIQFDVDDTPKIIFSAKSEAIHNFVDMLWVKYKDYSEIKNYHKFDEFISKIQIKDMRSNKEILRDDLSVFDVTILGIGFKENSLQVGMEYIGTSRSELLSQMFSMALLCVEDYPTAENIEFHYVLNESNNIMYFNMSAKDVLAYFSKEINEEEFIERMDIGVNEHNDLKALKGESNTGGETVVASTDVVDSALSILRDILFTLNEIFMFEDFVELVEDNIIIFIGIAIVLVLLILIIVKSARKKTDKNSVNNKKQKELVDEELVIHSQSSAIAEEKSYCSKCGNLLNKEDGFCSRCGKKKD